MLSVVEHHSARSCWRTRTEATALIARSRAGSSDFTTRPGDPASAMTAIVFAGMTTSTVAVTDVAHVGDSLPPGARVSDPVGHRVQ